jgi:hypothetical protein
MCRRRLEERAERQRVIEEHAAMVTAHVKTAYLSGDPEPVVEARFIRREQGREDRFSVVVYVDITKEFCVRAHYDYVVNETENIGDPVRVWRSHDQLYGERPTQSWKSSQGEKCFLDIVDAFLDETKWTLEDLT